MPIPRCTVSRYPTPWAESLEGAISGHQSWAVLSRYRCRLLLAEVPKGSDRDSELKLRQQMWEARRVSELIFKILGQQHSGPLRRRKREVLPQTDEQRGKRACAWRARGIHQQRRERTLVGGAAQSSADCGKNWTTALIELGHWNSSLHRVCRGGEDCLGWWKVQSGTGRDEGARPQQHRYRIAPARQNCRLKVPRGQLVNGRNI